MADDVTLCLDIEVDPASKKILSHPQRCRSALLDVTVLKSRHKDGCVTNTLRADEVRKLITSMEKDRRRKQKVLDKLKDDNLLIQIRKHEDRYRRDSFERKDFIGITESVQPLFCEIRRSLKNVETRISKMRDINLVISQSTVETEEVSYSRSQRNPFVYRVDTTHNLQTVLCKSKKDKFGNQCMCENCGIVGVLKETQKHQFSDELSQSNNTQKKARFHVEEKLEKDYIQDLSQRIKQLEQKLQEQEQRFLRKEHYKKPVSKVSYPSYSDTSIPHPKKKFNVYNCKNTTWYDDYEKKKFNNKATGTDEHFLNGFTWKWGEEIIKPGIDLKNRIVSLISDMLNKITICEPNKPKESPRTEHLKQFMKNVNAKVFHVSTNTKFSPRDYESPKALSRVDVSYINPKLMKEEGRCEFAGELDLGMREFLKIIAKSKRHQKETLWRNIWEQAVANNQDRDDKITIKIPNPYNDNPAMFETDITIGEVEKILKTI